jgi:hypothetical protein
MVKHQAPTRGVSSAEILRERKECDRFLSDSRRLSPAATLGPMKRRATEESIEPWIKIWLAHVAVTGGMWRGARSLNPAIPNPEGDALVALFEVQGPPPAVVRAAISATGRMMNELLREAPPFTRSVVALWIERHKTELATASDSLCDSYEEDIERVRRLPPEVQVHGRVPACAFEAIFASWLLKTKPIVLQRAVDLAMALFLALPSEPRMRKATDQLIKDLRTLNDIATRLGSHVETLRRDDAFQPMAANADALGLKRLQDALGSVVAVLAPHVSMLKTRGRRSDPLRSIVVRCLREAGLTDRDISRVFGVKTDAVRKQAAKAPRKRATVAQRSTSCPFRHTITPEEDP